MKTSITIRSIIAALAIGVFALAIAPKQLLHDVMAAHKHHFSLPGKEAKINVSGFICDCGNIVAESAFVHFYDPILISPELSFFDFSFQYNSSYQPINVQSFRLRGPPSM